MEGLSGISGLDAKSLYKSRFDEWKQNPATKDKTLTSDINKASQNFANFEIQNSRQRAKDWLDQENAKHPTIGKQILNGLSNIGQGIGSVGKTVLKGGELFGKAISIAEPLLHKDEIPENKNAQLSSNAGNTIANWAPTLGPGGWIYKGVHTLASGTGGMINGSNTGNAVTDGINGLLGAIAPGVGWLVSKSPEAYRDADVESSAMYHAAPQFAIEHGVGKYLVDRENINKEIKRANVNTFTISNDIIKPAQLAFSDANDSRHSTRLKSELSGGLNTVVNFGVNWAKQGTILQFGKRTLSKHKIKKQQSDKLEEVIIQEPINEQVDSFKEGGKVNVIPSGALHAHKHNLTEKAEDGEKFEDVTTKGIPVVVEDEKGNLIQQAEVEREEIIFRLEVTKKLEKLSKEHTDEAAIEAGKLLVKEILYNTEDNTGEML